MKRIITFLMAVLAIVAASAQSRNATLTISVTAGDELLEGQTVVLEQTDYSVGYGTLTLDADGKCTVKVYPGNHRLTVDRAGFETAVKEFTVASGDKNAQVSVVLAEKTRRPFALKADVSHDVFTGSNDIALGWNVEEPVFFDDFESYDPFAVSFGDWTGIDADGETTAALLGSYPNRGIKQYAQIINPLTVVPTWWYDYPILRPLSGKQYCGFIRTESGRANDDWLISPVITVGNENVLEFMAKAADRYDERFMVYVTEKTDNPGTTDFVRLDAGNYESVDYPQWKCFSYDLAAYAGKQIRFAIRYVSETNRYGAFMLMLDDVYVGQARAAAATKAAAKARRAAQHSPANPNETFRVYLDDKLMGSTDTYSYTLSDVAAGTHTVGIQAVYLNTVSEVTTATVNVPEGPFAKVSFTLDVDSRLGAAGIHIVLVDQNTGQTVTLVTDDKGEASVASLPYGKYALNISETAFVPVRDIIDIEGDSKLSYKIVDLPVDPYNITVDLNDDQSSALVRWNQELGFSDSFETYDDFATGSFGDWRTVDLDQLPVYPIALGSMTNIVSFPGSGTSTNPTAIAPMVFNPLKTVPAMSPDDPAIEAPDGVKTVIFFSPQRAQADKWLISPAITVREGYQLTFKAKGYASAYTETMQICVSENAGQDPSDFTVISEIDALPTEGWGLYTIPLDAYQGKEIRLALRYTSTDAFLAQVDEFAVGKADGSGDFIDPGNVVAYEVYLDGVKDGESTKPEYTLTGLKPGIHTVGIRTMYKSTASQMTEYTFGHDAGVDNITVDTLAPYEIYDLTGRRLDSFGAPGIYIVRQDGKTFKIKK